MTGSHTVAIAVAQFAPTTDPAGNLESIRDLVSTASDRGARLVVLPEYSSYFVDPFDESLAEHAQEIDGPFVEGLIGVAATYSAVVVAGLVERAGDGSRVRNAVVAVDASGVLARYRKLHLYDAFGQRQVAQYFTQQNSYHVVMEALPEVQSDPQSLDRIYVRSPTTGGLVPMAAFASWTTRQTQPLSISHQGQFPAVTISFNLAPGSSLGTATEAINAAERELHIPASLQTSFQGNAQAFQQSLTTIPLLIAAALFVVYLILGILYESYIHPLTILSTLPSAGAGALATLMLFGFDFSLVAMIGVILLIGIVKKNGIILVDFAINAERTEHLSPEEAIRKASLLRFRPIMMTTLAALLGGVPLMLGAGTGAEIRQPLGFAMVGGLAVSQVLTLFTTPVVYLYLDRLANWTAKLGADPTRTEVSTASPK